MFCRFFVDRPIFATVLSVILTLAGGVAVFTLPVSQYPEIAPPTVEVSAQFPGANATTVADTVAAPIEQQVNGVEDMLYMSSQCTNDGSYALTVTFRPGTDLNIAQVLVQNRVNLAQPVLPDLVKRRGVSVKKKSPTVLLIINLFSPEGTKDNLYLSNYATIQLRDELARVPGVGDITLLGQRDYAMRVWLDPERMASRGLAAADVVRAVEQQNVQVAAGQLGQPPAPNAQTFQFTLNALGRLTDVSQFEEMILKTDENGGVTRLKDVGRIELGAATYDQTCMLDGKPSVALSVYQLPGSNAIETAERVKTRMADLGARGRLPQGVAYSIVYDTTPFIRESVNEVFRTLRDAVLLVAGVMLAFLRTWRATLIPLVAVPVAIVGTFAAMAGFGFSLNTLTLFGLVLAVGIVVDDAIVVVEAVEHLIETGLSPREATIQAMDRVAGPVLAVGLVLAAVFVPCLFIGGIIGQFFRQFAVTIAISTLISAFNSLTLSPALCALLLKPKSAHSHEPMPRIIYPLLGAFVAYLTLTALIDPWIARLPAGWLANLEPVRTWLAPVLAGLIGVVVGRLLARILNFILGLLISLFNVVFNGVATVYRWLVIAALFGLPLSLLAYGVLIAATEWTIASAPVGFIPTQDKGYLLVNVQLPDAASLSRTEAVARHAEAIALRTPGVKHCISICGQSAVLSANAPNFATLYIMLAPFEEREGPGLSADEIAARLQAEYLRELSEALTTVLGAPPVDGLGTSGGFKLVLLDPSGAVPDHDMQSFGQETSGRLVERPDRIHDAFSGYRANTPWLELEIDRVKAAEHSVGVSEITSSLQVYFGTFYVNDFNRFGRTWQVTLQADAHFRTTQADLLRLPVRNSHGQMVPLRSFASVSERVGPIFVQRYNLYPAVTVTMNPAPGVSSGAALDTAEDVSAEVLPPSMRAEWTELAWLQRETKSTAAYAFILSVVLVFLVLAAQYESWALPLAVILVVPLCLLSAILGVLIAGLDVNIFTQVGFVVLVGLASKNAILIVEYARQRHLEGATIYAATLEACRLRFRPIVMTSVAFILGVVPLIVAVGPGAEMRRTLGTAVFAGMIGVTVFGVFLTPVFYFTIQWIVDRIARWRGLPVNHTTR